MVRIVLWWTGLAASVLLVVAAFGSQSGACVDSSNAAAHHPAQARGLAACFWLGWLPSRCRHGCSDVPIKSGVLATRRGSPAPTAERAVCASRHSIRDMADLEGVQWPHDRRQTSGSCYPGNI